MIEPSTLSGLGRAMSIIAEPAPSSPTPEVEVEKDIFGNPLGRGGFARDGRGSALVVTTDPFDIYKSGPKKGMLKTYAYKAASSIGVSVSTEGLDQWKQNRLLLATIIDPDLTSRLFEAMDGLDPESDEGKAVFRAFRDEAHEIAETQIAATRGTFAHWLTECFDNGESPLEGLAHGEAIGISPATASRIMAGWEAVNVEYGFKALSVEAKIINDEMKAAGTTDRVVELTKPLTVVIAGETVVLPVGTVVIVDFKSGKLRRAKRTGLPEYWHKYAAQIATYAGGHPYDPKNHVRMDWTHIGVPSRPSQDVGFIVHADLEALADDTSDADPRDAFSVFALDLAVGREYAAASNRLRVAESDAGKAFSHVEIG